MNKSIIFTPIHAVFLHRRLHALEFAGFPKTYRIDTFPERLLSTKKIKQMGFIREFKEFIMKGNILDLAIAVVIGIAFGAIVTSLVDDVITPLLLTPALEAAHVDDLNKLTWGAVKYGNFLSAVLKFLTISLILFGVIKAMNAVFKKKDIVAAGPTLSEQLLMEIRDALKK